MSNSHEQEKSLPTYVKHVNHPFFLMPQGFPVENFAKALEYKAQPKDLFVATYPKCGTTWMQHICYLMLNNGVPLPADINLTVAFPHLEEHGADFINDISNFPPLAYPQQKNGKGHGGDDVMRLIKTHLYYEMTPIHPEAKYIYVARNPKDVVVSFFYHTRGFVRHYNFGEGKFDDYFELFMKGEVDFGDYFESLKSWLPHLKDQHVFYLTYEDLKCNTRKRILELAEFIGGDELKQNLLANDNLILDQVVEHSSVKSMQKDVLRWSSARPADQTQFVRKGIIGDWRNVLSKDQSDRIDQKMNEYFTKEELKILWPNYDSL